MITRAEEIVRAASHDEGHSPWFLAQELPNKP
jgi:hypothetical protein